MPIPPFQGLVHHVDPNNAGEHVWDDTHYPIITLRTVGLPTESMQLWMYSVRNAVLDYAQTNNHKVVAIVDISRLKTPDSVQRKRLSELASEKDAPYRSTFIGNVFIVTNPLVRGLVTAVSWLAGEAMVPNFYTADLPAALKQAKKLYDSCSMEMPKFPDNYEFNEPTLAVR